MAEAHSTRAGTGRRTHWLAVLLGLVLLGVAGWCGYVARQIHVTAAVDEVRSGADAQTADAIAVFGAAQYRGRPSPVLHLRLDHAAELYRRHVAPLIITLGGGDEVSGRTEGGVGRDYLLAQGVPLADIIAETQSTNTVQQVHRLAAIARDHGLHRVVIVSDGTHVFRIRALCEDAGLEVLLSPRAPVGHLDASAASLRMAHEVVSYTAERLGIEFRNAD